MEPIVKLPLQEHLEFLSDGQVERFADVFPLIQPSQVRPYLQLCVKEMQEGIVPRVGGAAVQQLAALRCLLKLLRREAQDADSVQLQQYLLTHRLSAECATEIAAVVGLSLQNRPLRIRPILTSISAMMDISYWQRTGDRSRVSVILLLRWSDGSKRAITTTPHGLARLRLAVAQAAH